jgi:hypothetical protein
VPRYPQTPEVQVPLVQSLPSLHFFVAAQVGQSGPPQSTSVSLPSCLPFEQEAGAVQMLETHCPFAQSFTTAHPSPSGQGGQ